LSRVLIVGDDLTARELLRRLFVEQCGFQICDEAESEAAALEEVRRLSPSLIVLEPLKPLATGVARRLREAAPETPIFLLTEEYSVAVEKAALSNGVTAVFSKRDDLEALIVNARAVMEE
jgi:DNA-binding response OmpR family regulator